MATTTNYGWTTPDDTALVKDGAAAIRTLGSAIDTTTKNLNPETTLGDISYRSNTSNTNTRLAIGTSGQVLTVSGGVPAWSSPASAALTLVSATTFSSSASHSINNCFTSSYRYYTAIFDLESSAANVSLLLRLRASSSDTTTNYSYVRLVGYNAVAAADTDFAGSDEIAFSEMQNTDRVYGRIEFFSPQIAQQTGIQSHATGRFSASRHIHLVSGIQSNSTQFDGFSIYPASGNITGTIKVYGYGN